MDYICCCRRRAIIVIAMIFVLTSCSGSGGGSGSGTSSNVTCTPPQVLTNGVCAPPPPTTTTTCTSPLVLTNGVCVAPPPPACTPPLVPANGVCITPKLNDTGITASQCYQAGSSVFVACNSAGAIALNPAQDGMLGRDVTLNSDADGKQGFSFTAVVGGCVQDNVTGLMWEVKTTDGGLHDWAQTYTNYNSTASAQKWNGVAYVNPTQAEIDAATNTVGFVTAVNASYLCGYNDWRLPTADELNSIMDYGVVGLPIDATWFPNTRSDAYWSSDADASLSGSAWYVYFYDSVFFKGSDVSSRINGHSVRLVRAGP